MLRPLSVSLLALSCVLSPLLTSAQAHPLVNEKAEVTRTVKAEQFFQPVKQLVTQKVASDPQLLRQVAYNSLKYLESKAL